MSMRLTILTALASGHMTTLDDLQNATGQTRLRIVGAVGACIKGGLIIKRLDDVTRQPAYQITQNGRDWLIKYQPAGATPDSQATVVTTEPADVDQATPSTDPAVHHDPQPDAAPHSAATAGADDSANRQAELEMANAANAAWLTMAQSYGCESIVDLVGLIDRLTRERDIARTTRRQPLEYTGYALANGLLLADVYPTLDQARDSALEACTNDGEQYLVYALSLVGKAVPTAVWEDS